jgi:hypothetical protein
MIDNVDNTIKAVKQMMFDKWGISADLDDLQNSALPFPDGYSSPDLSGEMEGAMEGAATRSSPDVIGGGRASGPGGGEAGDAYLEEDRVVGGGEEPIDMDELVAYVKSKMVME